MLSSNVTVSSFVSPAGNALAAPVAASDGTVGWAAFRATHPCIEEVADRFVFLEAFDDELGAG